MHVSRMTLAVSLVLACASCADTPPTCEREVHEVGSPAEQLAMGFSLSDVLASHSEFSAELRWREVP